MTIKQKIVAKSLVTSLVVTAVGLLSTSSMLRIGRTLRMIDATELQEARQADQLEEAAGKIDHAVDNYRAALDNHQPVGIARLKGDVNGAFDQIAQATFRLDQTVRLNPSDATSSGLENGDALERHELDLIEQHARLSREVWSKVCSDIDRSGGASADNLLLEQLTIGTGTLLRDALDFEHATKADMTRSLQAAQGQVATSVHILVIAAAFAVVLSIVLALLVAMPLAARLARLQDGAVAVGKGNLGARIKVGSVDEIGQLAMAFNQMADDLRFSRDEFLENESKFRELAETIHEVFWVCDPGCTKIQYISPAYEQVWGRSCQTIYDDARAFAEAIVPQDRPRVLAALENLAIRGLDEEYRIARPDGTTRWIHARSFAVLDEAKVVKRIVGIAEDITTRKTAETARRQSEAMLTRAQRVANIGSWDWNPRSGELLWSEQYFRISDLDPSTFTPTYDAVLNKMHPDDRERVNDAVQEALAGREQYRVEYRLIARDQSVRTILAQGDVDRDETGVPIRMVGTALDVTDRVKAEEALQRAHDELEQRVEARTAELRQANEALRRSESELKQAKNAAEAANRAKSIVFDTALDAIITIDSRSVITAWNLQAETMFRWDRTEAMGRRLDQTIIPEHQWDAHRREIEAFLKTGEGPLLNKIAELIALRRDGREFPVELAITPAWSDGECNFTAFIRDITLRKQTEMDLRHAKEIAETASRAKSQFLANMSHEIRTPLNGVIGLSDLLMDTALDEKQRRFAELIKSSGVSLADLINDLLDFSKIEARKMEIESLDFDLYTVLEDVTEMMAMKASQKRLNLASLTMPDVPRQVKGDAQRIKQILINFVNNAIKFTESGSISTCLKLEKHSQDHLIVRFSVTDTGIGIPADRMDRLFKSFSQVDASTTRTYGGTGLGLAISKQLAELMGGSVGVESTAGQGSTFWFTVRLGLTPQVQASASTGAISFGGLRVLAMHESATMREILRSQLCSWGLRAVTASTNDEAMKMLTDAATDEHPFDVAILDAEHPTQKTLDLGCAIKARGNIARTVLLILLPVESETNPADLRAAGFAGHMIKPVRQSRLYESIVEAMSDAFPPKSVVAAPAPIVTAIVRESTLPQAHILIVEDNRVNQIVASEVLAKHGYAFEIVGDGRKAVAAVSAGRYDLILMDCSMPDMDGFEATRQIRLAEQTNPKNPPRHLPIIALTANAINGDRERCLEAGMDDYVSKPLDPKRLIKSIQTLLAKSDQPLPTLPSIEETALKAKTPSTTASKDATPLTIDVLLDRCMGSAETAITILDEFEIQAVADLAELKRQVADNNCDGTARVAHALKGAAGILSADALSDLAFKLERMGRAGVLTEPQQLLTQLESEIARCIGYLPAVRQAMAEKIKV